MVINNKTLNSMCEVTHNLIALVALLISYYKQQKCDTMFCDEIN